MYAVAGVVAAGLCALWKLLGKLLHPVVKKWLSRDVTLGFVHLVSLRRAHLEKAALDKISEALSTAAPLRAAEVHIGRITLSVGLLAGLRLRANDVHIVLEWVPEEDWDSAAEAIEASVQGRSAKEAKVGIQLVENKRKPKGLVPSSMLGVAESFLSAGWIQARRLQLSVRGKSGETLTLLASASVSTQRCWAIEWRGTRAKASLDFEVTAGGEALLSPSKIDLSIKMPRVLKTLLMPQFSPKKHLIVEASLKQLSVAACPASLRALAEVGNLLGRFGEWKASMERSFQEVVTLSPGEREAYMEALIKGEDVSKWEKYMTSSDILRAHSEWKQWEVPSPLQLEDWLRVLEEEQKMLRAIEASAAVQEIRVEALGQGMQPGDGFAVRARKLQVEARMLDEQAQAQQAQTQQAQAQAQPQRARGEVLMIHGPEKLRVQMKLESLGATSDANERLAMPVLQPCQLSAVCGLHLHESGKQTLHVTSHFRKASTVEEEPASESDAIVVTISSRSLWKLQGVLDELAEETTHSQDSRPKESKILGVANRRRQEHLAELQRLFNKLDADASGSLERAEVSALVTSLYGEYMTKSEIEVASDQLFRELDIDESGSVGLQELQRFFVEAGADSPVGMVCLRFAEFCRPLPPQFNALESFRDMAGNDALVAAEQGLIKPRVLQTQWVRYVQNYAAAKRLWLAEVCEILPPAFAEWRLLGDMRAVDFWNDPMFSLTGRRASSSVSDFGANLSLHIAGLSVRLADSQHACSVPRVRMDMQQLSLQGGLHMAAERHVPWCDGLTAELNVLATYWNERARSAEPFIEPWRLSLQAQGDYISVRAEKHLIVNLTPPFLQAVTVALASLQTFSGASQGKVDDSAVAVWVRNCTDQDLRVSVRAPAGQSKLVEIPKGDSSRTVPVEVQWSGSFSSMRLHSCNDSWTLAVEGGDASGQWSIENAVDFTVTGRQFFQAGSRTLAATTSVDVHSLAPILTLSGTTTVQNLTQKILTLTSTSTSYQATIKPGESCPCPMSEGHKLLLPVGRTGFEESSCDINLPGEHEAIEEDALTWKTACGTRFTLQQRDEELQNMVRPTTVKDRVLTCVPMLSLSNALPCSLECVMYNPGGLEHEDRSGSFFGIRPGEVQASDEIDPDQAVQVDVEVTGVRYQAVIPGGCLKTKHTVLRMQNATRKHVWRGGVTLLPETPEERCERTGADLEGLSPAPLLDLEFSWENESAVLVIFSRYWLANKTGWKLEASGDMNVRRAVAVGGLLQSETVVPSRFLQAPQRSSVFSSSLTSSASEGRLPERNPSEGRLQALRFAEPELALMRLDGNSLHLRLHWEEQANSWSWDERTEQCALEHWAGEEPQTSPNTGWSQGLAVEFGGTTGIVQLSRGDGNISELAGIASAVLGVSVGDLQAPFQRTKLITVVPRYIVRNDLEEAVQLWPNVGNSRCAPTGEAPAGLPVVQPGACLAIDAMPYESSLLSAAQQKLTTSPMVSVRSHVEGDEASSQWSLQVHLSMVGDTPLTLGTGKPGDPVRVVRASVQRSEATVYVILVKGRWPFGLENRSQVHTLAFHQKGARDMGEWVLNPCETRSFVFPDPDKPKQLVGRICGAGQRLTRVYDLSDLSHGTQLQPLMRFGHSEPALEVVTRRKAGQTQLLVISDAKEVPGRRSRSESSPTSNTDARGTATEVADAAEVAEGARGVGGAEAVTERTSKLQLDIFAMGLHASLVDTRQSTPVELLAFTVDYIQLRKEKNQRAIDFSIHNVQLDDFSRDDNFIFGPVTSGLNSQRSALAVSKDFVAKPLLRVTVTGPRNPMTPIFDKDRGILMLQAVRVALQPMEANVDVPRLVGLLHQLKSWLAAMDSGVAGNTADVTSRSLRRALAPGFPAPQRGGDTVCYIGRLQAEAIGLAVELRLSRRQGDDAGKEEMEAEALQNQLQQLSTRVWKPLRGPIDFLARMGASFAEAAPRFRFSPLDLRHVHGNLKVAQASVAAHYQSQIVAQVAKTLGSLQVLGDPVNLLDDIGISFRTFLQKTKEEIKGEREGIGEGVGDLAGGVFGGALGSMSKVSGSLKDLVGNVTGRPIGSDKRATCISDGIDLGLMSLATGISEAVTGFVEDPMQQAQTKGMTGFCKGSLQGTAGLVTRPIEGFLGAVEKFAQGAENQIRGMHRGYGGLRRPPRAGFQPGQGLQPLNETFFWPQWRMTVLKVSLPVFWKERKVKQLVVFPQQADIKKDNEVCIVRGAEADSWALEGSSPENDCAVGRTGNLRGPFQLQVDAMVDGNVEMANLFRVNVGCADLPHEELVRCLGSCTPEPMTFHVRAQRSPVLGEAFAAAQNEVVGEVVVDFTPALDAQILPGRFLDKAVEGLDTLGPAARLVGTGRFHEEVNARRLFD